MCRTDYDAIAGLIRERLGRLMVAASRLGVRIRVPEH